ncbi:MAG: PQQ-like beta-propeller repeat protein [Ignavibacteria bacterium]|nr:PQQ-like beta-propeller repeat protein [Ignavibacteria bacterium]
MLQLIFDIIFDVEKCFGRQCLCILLFAGMYLYSCSSLTVEKPVEINTEEDWLFIGGDPAKSNISKSEAVFKFPLNLYWEFDTDGGLSRNCLSAADAVLFVSTLKGECYGIDVTSGRSIGRLEMSSRASYSTPLIMGNSVVLISTGNIDGGDHQLNFIPAQQSQGGKLYAGAINGAMYCFNAKDGKSKWKFETGGSIFADATADSSRIYFGSDDLNFYCLDSSGNLVWKKDLGTKFLSASTFYKDQIITAGIDGKVYSINKNNGEVKWTFRTKGPISGTPLLHGDKIFIGSFDKKFYCLNAEDGSIIWSQMTEGRVRSSAVIWKDYVFVAGDDKYVYCFSNKVMKRE